MPVPSLEKGEDMYPQKNSRILKNGVFILCLFSLLLISGCMASREVQKTLDETNKALEQSAIALRQAALPPEVLPNRPDARIKEPWYEPCAKIDAFITTHPDDKITASSLRVRQAMLLLSYEQYNLAKAAFSQATELHLARDKALKALADQLIWYFKVDQETAPGGEIDDIIKAFSEQIDILKNHLENESVHDYLAEMRAWIHLYKASHAINGRLQAVDIGNAMDSFAETLKDEDITAVNQNKVISGNGTPISLQARRQIRAMAVIERASELVDKSKSDGGTVIYKNEKAKKIEAINR